MINILGLPLEEALHRLKEQGTEPEIVHTAGFREAAEGALRVIRISEDGRRLTVARFPDAVKTEEYADRQ